MNRISTLLKRTLRAPSPFLPGRTENTAVCEPGSRTSPDTESAVALTLDFQPPE